MLWVWLSDSLPVLVLDLLALWLSVEEPDLDPLVLLLLLWVLDLLLVSLLDALADCVPETLCVSVEELVLD